MKKIIAVITLALLSLSILVGCAASVGVDYVNECYARSYPYRIEVSSVQQVGGTTLECKTVMVRGLIGSDFVAKKIVDGEEMRSLEEGSGKQVYDYVKVSKEETWFRASEGVSYDKGKTWDVAGENFFPDKGKLSLGLESRYLKDAVYEDGIMDFVISAADTEAVFGASGKVDSDVRGRIETAGGFVTSVEFSWVEAANFKTGVDTMTVTIKADYIYDQQNVTFN